MDQIRLTLDYWRGDDWYVGQLRELPSVLSQGKTLEELQENIQDAYALVMEYHASQASQAQAQSVVMTLAVPATARP